MGIGIEGMLMAKTWEETKGSLRACVSLTGSVHEPTHDLRVARSEKYLKFNDVVEQFIKNIEDHGLCE